MPLSGSTLKPLSCGQLRRTFGRIFSFDRPIRTLIFGERRMSTNMIVPGAPAVRASDDEILGLSTNTARKPSRNNAGKIAEAAQANTVSPASVDDFLADLENQHGAGDNLVSDADADETQRSDGVANSATDQEKLNGVLEANPE